MFSLELPGDPGPIYCQPHFPWKDNRCIQLICQNFSQGTSKIVNCSTRQNAGRFLTQFISSFNSSQFNICVFDELTKPTVCATSMAVSRADILPSMCNKKLHSLFHSGSERILTCQQQQQLCRGQLQQHACDFTGKCLRIHKHSRVKKNNQIQTRQHST